MSLQIHFTDYLMRQRARADNARSLFNIRKYALTRRCFQILLKQRSEKTSKLMLHIHNWTSCGGGKSSYKISVFFWCSSHLRHWHILMLIKLTYISFFFSAFLWWSTSKQERATKQRFNWSSCSDVQNNTEHERENRKCLSTRWLRCMW